MMRVVMAVWLLLCCVPAWGYAQLAQPETILPDAAQESRARALFYQLRCEVCEGQSIADSNADLAQDMRRAVRQHISAGKEDAAILEYFSARYGRGILMRPPLDASTAPLWLAPLLLLLLGGWVLARYFRRSSAGEKHDV